MAGADDEPGVDVLVHEDRSTAPPRDFSTRKLHKRLHTHRTFDEEQILLNRKAPQCGAFAEPSDGLEPSTPSLPIKYLSGVRRVCTC